MSDCSRTRIGQQIGNYRLLSWLGQGGFADVYLGEHVHLSTRAAIKILKVSLPDEERENFLNEARTIAKLEHPHIVRVLECGIENDIPFLVMSYAVNGSLRQRYPRGKRLSPEQALPYVQQAAAALYHAHQQKLVHRDVKPENMLLDSNEQLLLGDFGLVRVVGGQSTGSQSAREMAGTVPYMAPEQLQGKVQFASDQYALGIVTYEWLCGERPFNGSFVEIASQHMLIPPPPLREKVPTLSEEVEHMVLCALAKDPVQRFAHIEAFAQALADAIEGKPSASVTLHPSVFPHPDPSGGTSPLSSENIVSPPTLQPTVKVPTGVSNRQGDVNTLHPTASLSSVITKTRPALPFPSIPLVPTAPASTRRFRRYQNWWQNVLLLIVLFIFLTSSAGVVYTVATGWNIPRSSGKADPRSSIGPTTAVASTITLTPAGTSKPAPTPTIVPTHTPTIAPLVPMPTIAPMPTPTTAPTPIPTTALTPTPGPPCLSVTPTSLTFRSAVGQDPPNQTLTVTNCGNTRYPLDYTTGSNWILIYTSGSTINGGSSMVVTIGVWSANASAGTNTGSVTFFLSTLHQTVPVTYIVG